MVLRNIQNILMSGVSSVCRPVLVTSSLALLLSSLPVQAAPDPCPVGTGGILQCSGNQSAGIAFFDVAGVRVFNLSQDIDPATPLDAIQIVNVPGIGPSLSIAITVDATAKKIRSAGGNGIEASTEDGTINILTSADMISKDNAIQALSGKGSVTISQNGNLTVSDGNGITAQSNSGGQGDVVVVQNTGSITARLSGIVADGYKNVSIINSGALASSGTPGLFASGGIFAKSTTGFSDIDNKANIATISDAINAITDGTGAITIKSQGSLASSDGRAIVAQANLSGAISIDNNGAISGRTGGIFASALTGTSAVSITTKGGINSADGFGIEVNNGFTFTGAVNVTQFDTINALTNAIKVESLGDIKIRGFGTLNSTIGSSILVNQLNPPSTSVGNTVLELRGAVVFSHDGSALELNGKDVRVDASASSFTSTIMPAININGFGFVRLDLGESTVSTVSPGGPAISAIEAVTSGPGNMQLVFSQTNTTGKETKILAGKNGVDASVVSGDLSVVANTNFAPAGALSLRVEVSGTGFDFENTAGNTSGSLQDAVFKTGETGIFSRNINPGSSSDIRQRFDLKNTNITAGNNGVELTTRSGISQLFVENSNLIAKINGVDMAGDILYLVASKNSTITGDKIGVNVVGISTNFSGFRATLNSGSKVSGEIGFKLGNLPSSEIFVNNSEITGTMAAIVSTGGAADKVRIETGGLVNGTVDLDDGTVSGGDMDVLDIISGGRLNAGTIVDVGKGAFTNSGVFSPGGKGVVTVTSITAGGSGSGTKGFQVVSAGVIEIDLKKNNVSDQINVAGNWNLAGKVVPNLISLGSTGVFDLVTGDTALLGDRTINIASSPGLQYSLTYVTANVPTRTILRLTVKRAALGGLTGGSENNAGIFGSSLDKGVNAPGDHPAFQQYVNGLATQASKSALQQGLKEGAGEVNVVPAAASRAASRAFSGALMSCPVDNGSLYSAIDEGQCAWVNGTTRYLERDGDAGTIELSERANGIAGGFQSKLDDTWFVGGALAYEGVGISTDIGASSSGERLHAGAVVKFVKGANKIAFSAYGGAGWFDTTRIITIPLAAQATSSQSVRYFGANLRLSHTFKADKETPWSITPMIDFAANYVYTNGFSETGAGGLNLSYSASDDLVFSVSPAIEFGGESSLKNGGLLRAYARIGATFAADNSVNFSATLQSAPTSTGSFNSFTGFDDITGDVHIGLDFVDDKWFARLQADGKFGAATRVLGANLKVGLSF